MGYKPLTSNSQWHPTTSFIFIFTFIILSTTTTSTSSTTTTTTTSSTSTPLLQPEPEPEPPLPHNYPLKPSITILIGSLTTIFSITFLLLLYAKHCRRSNNHNRYPSSQPFPVRSIYRDNSGIDRTIIESLPVFRFGSLSGQKDGLECAVCLSLFNPSELLRLLPKCKHAFHVECVDTWLDAHSTCPLCRYRVDPEDIFLILNDHNNNNDNDQVSREVETSDQEREREVALRRVSGRHSSAGEKVTGLQMMTKVVVDQRPSLCVAGNRRSLDGWRCKKLLRPKQENATQEARVKGEGASLKYETTRCCTYHTCDTSRVPCNGIDTDNKTKKKEEHVTLKVERYRKDEMLLAEAAATVAAEEDPRQRRSLGKRFEHRIMVGTSGAQRWSDVQPSDLLYLRSEMILSDVRRLKRLKRSGPSVLHEGNNGWWQSGRGVINSRSVSEMTGLSRFGSNEEGGVVSRLLARLSEPKSGRNSSSSNV